MKQLFPTSALALATIAVTLAAVTAAALAAPPKSVGSFRDWTAYVRTDGGEKQCYITSEPKSKSPRGVRRGEVNLLVTNWPARNIRNQVSVITGYTYKKGSTVKATIGARSFDLFTSGNRAWLYDASEDEAMVRAMVRGSRLVVEGVSNRNTTTVDRYSLSGFTAASKASRQACAN